MIRFKPKTQEELDAEGLLPEGVYPYRVLEAEEATDKNGEGFFKLKLAVYDDRGKDHWVFDNVSPNWMGHKLRHLCEHTGLLEEYETGELDTTEMQGREGFVEVFIEPANGKYAAKNAVRDYVEQSEAAKPDPAPPTPKSVAKKPVAAPKPPRDPDLDEQEDDIPF